MKTLLHLTNKEAKQFLLKDESYTTLELPKYFTFQNLLKKIDTQDKYSKIDQAVITNLGLYQMEHNVNYVLKVNKDGNKAWRPFTLVNPILYAGLVNVITSHNNWGLLIKKLAFFNSAPRIQSYSLPAVGGLHKKDLAATILNWWEYIEQQSISLASDFNTLTHTDISNCYGSLDIRAVYDALNYGHNFTND